MPGLKTLPELLLYQPSSALPGLLNGELLNLYLLKPLWGLVFCYQMFGFKLLTRSDLSYHFLFFAPSHLSPSFWQLRLSVFMDLTILDEIGRAHV